MFLIYHLVKEMRIIVTFQQNVMCILLFDHLLLGRLVRKSQVRVRLLRAMRGLRKRPIRPLVLNHYGNCENNSGEN